MLTEDGWAFEELLQRTVASYPGETFEERLDAMAAEHPWMNDDLLAQRSDDGLP